MSTISINTKKMGELDVASSISESDLLIIHDGSGMKTITADKLNPLIGYDSVGFHNGIFRGKDLTDVYTIDELQALVAAEDFSDIFVGDYITVSITTSYAGTEEVDLVIGGINYFYNNGSTALETPHLIMFPRDSFATLAAMNSSNTTSGGYVGSAMYTTVLPVYASALSSALNDHMLSHYRYLTTTVSTSADSAAGAGLTGSSTACSWSEETLCLMSEPMVYGCACASSSVRDISDAQMQIPIFTLRPDYKIAGQGKNGSRYGWWLSGVASSTHFCHCSYNGLATYGSASNARGVRPYFLFG